MEDQTALALARGATTASGESDALSARHLRRRAYARRISFPHQRSLGPRWYSGTMTDRGRTSPRIVGSRFCVLRLTSSACHVVVRLHISTNHPHSPAEGATGVPLL